MIQIPPEGASLFGHLLLQRPLTRTRSNIWTAVASSLADWFYWSPASEQVFGQTNKLTE